MEDPGKRMVKEMSESTELTRLRSENKAFRAMLRDAQRLLSQAISERDAAKARLERERSRSQYFAHLLESIEERWVFRLYPRWIRNTVRNHLGGGWLG